jgi:ribosome biogenesis GTPase
LNLEDYGFDPAMLPEPDVKEQAGIPARVTAVHKERYELVCNNGPCFGRLKASVYYGGGTEPYPTTGDFVLLSYQQGGDSLIVKTLRRKSFFSRRDPTPGRGEQAVAANSDAVFILQSLNQNFNLRRLERYLTLAWQSGAAPVVILTKADLTDDSALQVRDAERIAAGVPVYAVSARTGYGLEALADYLKPGKTIVFLGSSGVGKSSLVNALAGEEVMAVNEIREDDARGRHTTTHRQLIMLKSGVMIIDTPGMRELGMWDVTEGLGEAFSDVDQYLGQCKFSDCRHQSEPGCAVKAAILRGELSRERWESYMKLKSEARYSDDKGAYMRQKQQWGKDIAKKSRQLQKADYRHEPCAESFTCKSCGAVIAPEGAGSQHRNHCPKCLSSVHADIEPGDRASLCQGVMDPIGVWVRKNGEWALIHRCRACGALSSNRIAADDNPTLLMSIAVKPLATPPFPLGQLEQGFYYNEKPQKV